MQQYQKLLKEVLEKGKLKGNRTDTPALSLFGYQLRFDLQQGFPAVTTKKLAWKSVVSELLWFIEGSTDERRLCEILYGTRDTSKKTIWTGNANAPYWKPKAEYEGDLGKIYGYQLRKSCKTDQLMNLIHSLKTDPDSRRHMVVLYNPHELAEMALPACHSLFQMYVEDNKLSCQLYARSQDLFLGTPFNIASYSLLTHMLAQVCGFDVGEFILSIGDAHLYTSHIDVVKEQLKREPLELPKLWLNPEVKDIEKFTMNDIKLIDYNHHSQLIADMMV